MGLARDAIRGTVSLGLLNTIRYIVSFGSQILLARLLTPNIFGIVALSVTILTFLSLLTRWGTAEALIREPDRAGVFSTVFWLRVASAIVVLGIVLVSSFGLRLLYQDAVVTALVALTVPRTVSIVSTPFAAAIQREFQLLRIGAVQLTAVLVGVGGALWLISTGETLWALVGFYAIQDFSRAIGMFVLSPEYPSLEFNRNTARWFLGFSKDMLSTKTLNSLEDNGDDYLVGSLAGTTALGLYSISWRLSTAFKTIVQPAINRTILPTFANIRDSEVDGTRAIEFLFRMQLYATIPVYIASAIVAPELIHLVFGPKWSNAVPVFVTLALTGILSPLVATGRHFYYSRGEPKIVLHVQKYYIPVFILSMAILVPMFGGVGAAVSVNLMNVIALGLLISRIRSDVDLSVATNIIPPIIGGVITVAVLTFMRLSMVESGRHSVLIIVAFSFLSLIVFWSSILVMQYESVVHDASVVKRALLK